MGTISTDFTAMMNGTATTSTYLLYGGGALVGFMLLQSLMGKRR